MPTLREFLYGMSHKNDGSGKNFTRSQWQEWQAFREERWHPVKAIGSFKIHYLKKRIEPNLDQNLGRRWKYKFEDMWPDTNPASSGEQNPLSPEGKATLFRQMGLRNNKDFVKHLLNLHEGESRIVIDKGFTDPLPPSTDILHPNFWNYQFVSNHEVRKFLYFRNGERHLTYRDVLWVMQEERYQTKILQWNPPASSGGRIRAEDFSLRVGNFITLAELFDFGQDILSCYHLYMMYINMDIYIQKKAHSVSGSPEAILKDNAKKLSKKELGTYALPPQGGTWG